MSTQHERNLEIARAGAEREMSRQLQVGTQVGDPNLTWSQRRAYEAELESYLSLDQSSWNGNWADEVRHLASILGKQNEPYIVKVLNDASGPKTHRDKLLALARDPQVIQDLARSGNKAAAEELVNQADDAEASAFREQTPDYYASQNNMEALNQFLDEQNLPFTAANLRIAFDALVESGKLEQDPNQLTELSAAQINRLSALALNSRPEDLGNVAMEYIRLRAPKSERRTLKLGSASEQEQFLYDNPDLVLEASYFVFRQTCPDYEETEARVARINQLIEGKFCTVGLLLRVWEQIKREESGLRVGRALNPSEPEPTQAEVVRWLDGLNDQEIEQTLAATRRLQAQQSR
jgi:hypothetical protein